MAVKIKIRTRKIKAIIIATITVVTHLAAPFLLLLNFILYTSRSEIKKSFKIFAHLFLLNKYYCPPKSLTQLAVLIKLSSPKVIVLRSLSAPVK